MRLGSLGAILLAVALLPHPARAQGDISLIQIPIRVSIAPVTAQAEREVPKSITKLDVFEMDEDKRFGAKYAINRDPITISGSENFFAVSTRAHYGFRACRRTYNLVSDSFSMWPCVSCGLEEPRRVADVLLHTRLRWNAAWHLDSSTTALPTKFRNRCTTSLLNIDLTDRVVAPLVDSQMRAIARTIDREIPRSTTFRPHAKEIWDALQIPQPLGENSWLVIEPLTAGFGPIRGSGNYALTTLTVRARSRVVFGGRPPNGIRPLPNVTSESDGATFHVPLEVQLTYQDAAALAKSSIGDSIRSGDYTIRVESIAISSIDRTHLRVNANIDLLKGTKRKYHGPVVLDGLFAFDPAKLELKIVSLDYALQGGNLFFRIADRFVHERVRSAIQQRAEWQMKSDVERARIAAEAALNRKLAPSATLVTRISSMNVTRVVAEADRFRLFLEANGTSQVNVVGW
jgi:hypothetical protein